ncbi:MAG: UDP-glucose 4-epimerase GalE [Limnochordaceae bacterium]|nr:UDP-glucose 4-epimerase GalE [Limnochordaceae bacterium]
MNVLVTGGAGYVGSHAVLALLEAGHDVTVLDDLSSGHPEAVRDVPLAVADVTDRGAVERLVRERGPFDAAMHFAGKIQVGESVRKPDLYFHVNVVGTLHLLELLARHGTRWFVFSSSAAVYGEPETVPIPEEHPLRPTSPYGETKRAVEAMLPWWEKAYGLRWVSLRYFNAAGADPRGRAGERHDPETHLIPIVLQVALGRRDAVEVYGTDWPTADGTCVRDFVHVSDLATAHRLALEHLGNGGASGCFNLGGGQGWSVRQVIEVCRQVTGRPIPVREAPRRPGDPAVLVADPARARRQLRWQPQFSSLETIVRTAWDWHKAGY